MAPEPSRAREHVFANGLGESRAAEQPFMIGNLAEQSLLLAREAGRTLAGVREPLTLGHPCRERARRVG